MGLRCNIDAKGKAVRLTVGLVAAIAGAALALTWAMRGGGWVAWVVSVALVAYGAFAIFEGWAGWCVVRAMGFKTRL